VGDSDRFSVKTGDDCKGQKYANVIFCAPPSGFDDYPAAVEDAASNLWEGPSGGGVFVFTSSGGMYVRQQMDAEIKCLPIPPPKFAHLAI
jgi:hypothetical protein